MRRIGGMRACTVASVTGEERGEVNGWSRDQYPSAQLIPVSYPVVEGVLPRGVARAQILDDPHGLVQAYFPKKPGNFAQHFLEICHGNRSRSGMGLLHIHMERAPHRFFFRKNVEVAKSHSFPIEFTFFSEPRGDVARRGDFLAF